MRKLLSVIVAMVFAMSLATAALAGDPKAAPAKPAEPAKKEEGTKPAAKDNTAPAKAAPAPAKAAPEKKK